MGSLGGIYYAGVSAGKSSKQTEWDEAVSEQRRLEAKQSDRAARNFEAARVRTRTVYRTITQEVDRIVERPVYRNVCLDDDGLRLANCAIRGESPDTCKPDKPVPTSSGASGRQGGDAAALDHADG